MKTHIIPAHIDPVWAPFWAAAKEGRLSLQHCGACSYVRFPASERCPECWTPGGSWREVAPSGRVWSHTSYRRALHPELADAVPYTVAMVQLDRGPRIPGRLTGLDGRTPVIGEPVRGVFTVLSPDITMIEWVPAGPAGEPGVTSP
ncbi:MULTISPECIES: Zn-ribbon domain-containing OB-fold protein [Streptomyces]|uniref:OB-fold protein n=2 Tax=Streptomyces TaxID=1883 RepID=A0ABT9KVD4_9ACTN|nr:MULTISPECIES: OB-fold domain-containing protein [Streptomyces]MBW8092121.1 OB-fold domain-containing protein [Streptomyces hygroscopicus subsp. hygroscopicus]MCO8305744.1 OB-fold domain-containing protein [Streptomyces sp. RKCA744]MDP9611452.1 putative OB-fold protein [Streptomyces demainii]GHJ25659.1 hypothetical protein TPA0910_00920 [Streptomyces hygroscopicus]